MRYKEIKELFEPKPEVTIDWKKSFSDESNASIVTPSGHSLEVNFWEISPGVVSIDFTIDESHELTNHKEEIAVFNGVINSIREYISKHPVKDVLFQVKKTEEGKRLSAYVKMAARLASSLGFRQGSIEELESVDPKLYSRFDNRYSKLLWYTRAGAQGHTTDLKEFAPGDGEDNGRKFIPWEDFVRHVANMVGDEFSVKMSKIPKQVKAVFTPHDVTKYGPTQIYAYWDRKGVAIHGGFQLGSYQKLDKLYTHYKTGKLGDSKYVDFTLPNVSKFADIIQSNTDGALQSELNEFLDDRKRGDDDGEISKIVITTDRLLKQGYRVDLGVVGAMGRVYRADFSQTGFTPNGALAFKRKTRSFIRPFIADDDDNYEFEMVGPRHYRIVDVWPEETKEDRHPNERPPGPESKPTMPAGTVRVDVSDVYDWYKLGQHISDLKGLGKHDFGKGPPSTILSFGSEQEEHEYLANLEKIGLTTTDIDPIDPKQPRGMKRQKTDPTYNVNEGKVIGADQLVNVYVRGKHKGETFNKLIARDFPNKHIDQLIQKLVDKHNVNPNAIVYGIPGQDLEEDWKSALAQGALAGAVALGGAAQAKAVSDPYQSYTKDPIAQIIQQRQAELSAKDKKTVQQVNQRIAQAKKTAVVKKSVEEPYKPITGSKLETSLYNFAKKIGLKGTELAAFMAQTAHETDYFKTLSEYSSGEQYEGRKDLGNIYKGDGVKYKGRGFIQITGRYNYTQAAKDLGIDLVKHPELAERPDVAAKVTWWYWKNRVRPNVASFADVKQVTKQINPALRGLEKRRQFTKDFKIAQK